MTTIQQLREIVEHIRSLPNKRMKATFLDTQPREVLNFLGGNINLVGIGPEIFQEIQIGQTNTDLNGLINAFDVASKVSSSTDKRTIIHGATLTQDEKDFVGQALYSIGGNLQLGVSIQRVSKGIEDVIAPMLAANKEFDPSQYQIEPKLDGYRLVARKVDGEIILHSRNGKPLASEKITKELNRCLPEGSVIDGEILALDGNFESLRRHGSDVQYQVFDCLYADGQNIMQQPLTHRRAKLEGLDLNGRIGIPKILDLSTMNEVDDWIRTTGAEGVIAKDRHEAYKPKNRGWIKRKIMSDLNAKIVGMTAGTGKRIGMLGAIVVAPEGLDGVETKVGTGFSDIELTSITQRINAGEQLNCVVRYQDITKSKKLRFPVFLRLI